jgi:protein CpxP
VAKPCASVANSTGILFRVATDAVGPEIAVTPFIESREEILANHFRGNQTMIPSNRTSTRATTAAATLLGALFLATPLFAAPGDSMSTTNSSAPSSRELVATAPAPMSPVHGNSPIETRIKELHARLHITDAQKTQWDNLAQVMRENAQAMTDMQKQRAADAKTMTAVDVVKSYSEVIQAHEEGMKKFVPAFEDLYNSLSDQQKKTADSMFRGRARSEARKVASKES